MGVEEKFKDLIRENAKPKRTQPSQVINIRNSRVVFDLRQISDEESTRIARAAPVSPLRSRDS